MAAMNFYYSVMAAGKSTYALQMNHSLKMAGFSPQLMKPAFDTRDEGIIKSRIGIEHECKLLDGDGFYLEAETSHVIVDEAQFLDSATIEALRIVADEREVPVYLFGLRTAYTGKLFPAVAEIMAICDSIVELPLIAKDGNKATMHVRYIDDVPIFSGEPTIVGDVVGIERYESVSRAEYFKIRDDQR